MTIGSIEAQTPARILVAVTFHYRGDRLQYLFQVIRSLSTFDVAALDIVIHTNTSDERCCETIRNLCLPLLPKRTFRTSSCTLKIASFPGLSDPWLLPWCHKDLISDVFIAPQSGYTHFLYLEDDILFSYDNFLYFQHFSKQLRPAGLIPSFQRVEYNTSDNHLYFLDQIGASAFQDRRRVHSDGYAFVNLDFPHVAMYVLDQDLAREYVTTRSFDRRLSQDVRPEWGICERASMGLCFENCPEGFAIRYVAPVDLATLTTPSWSWVYHLPNNYSQNAFKPFAKTRVDQIFSGEKHANVWRPPSALHVFFDRAWRKIAKAI
jgi:hypothetical protein